MPPGPASGTATGSVRCNDEGSACPDGRPVIKWLLTVLLALIVFAGLRPLLRRLGIGRLPGDFTVRWRGRDYGIPLASTVLLSLIAAGVARLL